MPAKKTKNVSTKAADEAKGAAKAADRKTMTVSVDEAVEGLGEEHPSTAPVPFEEAIEQEKEADEDDKKLSVGKRLDRLERAYAASTGRPIDEF
jgi:hypothetical protein